MNYFPNNQTGAALIVGMVILLAMTILGTSMLSRSTFNLKIAANTQNQNLAFQAAASTIEEALEDTNLAALPKGTIIIYNTINPSPETEGEAEIKVYGAHELVGGLPCAGVSLTGGIGCKQFDVTASGRHESSKARSTQVQGAYIIAAAPAV